jgi:hypothetical protein
MAINLRVVCRLIARKIPPREESANEEGDCSDDQEHAGARTPPEKFLATPRRQRFGRMRFGLRQSRLGVILNGWIRLGFNFRSLCHIIFL